MNEREEYETRQAHRAAAIETFGKEAVNAVYFLIDAVTDTADATRISGEFYGQSHHGQMVVKPLSGNATPLNGATRVPVGGHRSVMAVFRQRRLVGFTYTTSNMNSDHLMFASPTVATRQLWRLAAPVLREYRISYKPDRALLPHDSQMH